MVGGRERVLLMISGCLVDIVEGWSCFLLRWGKIVDGVGLGECGGGVFGFGYVVFEGFIRYFSGYVSGIVCR